MVETAFLERRYDEETLEQAYDTLETLQGRRQPIEDLDDRMESSILYHLLDTADDLEETIQDPYINEITVEMDEYQELLGDIDDALEEDTFDDRLTSAIEQRRRFDDGYSEDIEGETIAELNDELQEIEQRNSAAVTKRALALKALPALGLVGGAAAGPAGLAVAGGLGGLGAGLYSTIERWTYGRGRELNIRDEIADRSMDAITSGLTGDLYVAVEDEHGYTGRPLDRDRDEEPSYEPPSEEEREQRNQEVIEFVEQFEDIDR